MAYIQKRGKAYRIRVSCGYTDTGKQITRSMTWTPPAGLNARQTEKELKRVAYEFESRADGSYISDGSIKLSEYSDKYLTDAASRLSPVTLRNYKKALEAHILPLIGYMRLRDIRSANVQDVVRRLSKTDSKAGGIIKPSAVKTYIIPLKAVLAEAVREGIIGENPAGSGRIVYPKAASPDTQILTKAELIEVLDKLEDESLENRLLVHLAVASGCRAGELAGLMWEDIDFEASAMTVRRSAYIDKGGVAYLKDPKTRESCRRIALPPYVVEMLRHWYQEQLEMSLLLGDLWKWEGTIFCDSTGGIRPPSYISAWWRNFLKRSGLPHIKFHALRHTSATLLITSGASVKSVSARLGHTNISTTSRYMHVVDEADRAAADVFERIAEEEKTENMA